ncbi:MAG: DUF3606 domain-containing protein [Edaphobacter sp.]
MSHPDQSKPHEHEEVEKSKLHTPHPEHTEASLSPHDPKEINPKMSSDIHYWAKEFNVTGDQLHEAIRVHGTHVEKVRAALSNHKAG